MDIEKPNAQVSRSDKKKDGGTSDSKGSLKRRVANDAIKQGEGSALGTMVVQADNVTMTINFNF